LYNTILRQSEDRLSKKLWPFIEIELKRNTIVSWIEH
jgi:hypothetical protein